MSASSNAGGEVRGITAADLASMSERLDVIADDIVILTRERDEARGALAAVEAVCGNFDPTCGTARTRTFLADLRAVMTETQ